MNRFAVLSVVLLFASPAFPDEALLRSGDTVAVIGGSFIERMQQTGTFEAELQRRRPDLKLRFRNLGWSGDDVHGTARKAFGAPEDGFKRLLRDLETAAPSVAIVGYGVSEAADGEQAVRQFESGLTRLVTELQSRSIRVGVLAPPMMPGYRRKNYVVDWKYVRGIISRVAASRSVPILDGSLDLPTEGPLTTSDGLLLSGAGYERLAETIADPLLGPTGDATIDGPLCEEVIEKDRNFFHRFRPQNETYLFLFRKHEQGQNASEVQRFDDWVESSDTRIWEAAKR